MVIKKNMELSDKDICEVAEKLDIEQQMIEESEIVENVYNQLIKDRVILINDIISENTIEKVIMPLIKMDNDGTGEEITIYINTNGGSVNDGLPLCNIIERLKTKTKMIILGYAYSMGALIMMAGKNNPNVTRYCYPFSTALIHGGSTYISGTSSQVKDYFKFNEKYEKKIEDYIITHTNLTPDDYLAIERYEAYLDAEDMLDKGLVDEIL